MTAATFLSLVVLAAGFSRLVMIVAVDEIGAPFRRLFDPEGFVGRLVSCPDCVSVWMAPPVLVAWLVWPTEVTWTAAAFGLSLVAALVSRRY